MEPPMAATCSEPTLRRLPLYHHYLKQLLDSGRDVVSATRLADDLKLDPTQVRKDLAVTGVYGRPRVGHSVPHLLEAISTFLGWNNTREAFLVGAGNLGRALLAYEGFADYGLHVVAAFDTNPEVIGHAVAGKEVLPLAKLEGLVRRMHIKIGIITVPAAAAQDVADLMVGAGIAAIWNFAPVHLNVPDEVIVEDTRLYATLASLSRALAERAPQRAAR